MMVSSNYIKGALLVALIALCTVHAVQAENSSGKPDDGAPIAQDVQVENTMASTTVNPDDDKNTTIAPTPTPTTPKPDNTTTTTTPTTPTTTSTTEKPTTTPSTSTTEKPTTTTVSPNSTTTSTTPTTPTPAPNSTTTVEPPTSTTPEPTPVPHCKRFDAFSFIGGMILAYGSLAIGLVLYKFYTTRLNPNNNVNANYRTL